MTGEPHETAQAQAADWMMRQRSGEMTAAEARAFDRWLDADAAHRAAFDEMQAIWDEAGEVREDPAILALREADLRAFNRPARLRLAAGALAAGLALAVFGGWALLGERPDETAPGAPAGDQVLKTGVGQTTTAMLRDGSTVVLDSDTVLRAGQSGGRRVVRLDRGGAFFQVAKDPAHPFVVYAGDKTITALGTAFEARLASTGKLDVTLVEGKVKVEAKTALPWREPKAMNLKAGERLTAADDQRWRVQKIDTDAQMSWLAGRLTFFNDTLAEAAAKVNRFSDRKIIVDPAIADAPIVGVFAAGDTDRFVRGMELAGIARVGAETDDTVELTAPGPDAAP